jgi:hypothetical protein
MDEVARLLVVGDVGAIGAEQADHAPIRYLLEEL